MSRSPFLSQFQAEFPDEITCAEFLIRRRWLAGIVCPTCRGCRATRLRSHAFECLRCGRQTSVTAGMRGFLRSAPASNLRCIFRL